MVTVLAYVGAALTEIAGCFAFWAWLRLGQSPWWVAPGILSLVAFAYLLTLVEQRPLAARMRPMAAYTSSFRSFGFGSQKGSGPTPGTPPGLRSASSAWS